MFLEKVLVHNQHLFLGCMSGWMKRAIGTSYLGTRRPDQEIKNTRSINMVLSGQQDSEWGKAVAMDCWFSLGLPSLLFFKLYSHIWTKTEKLFKNNILRWQTWAAVSPEVPFVSAEGSGLYILTLCTMITWQNHNVYGDHSCEQRWGVDLWVKLRKIKGKYIDPVNLFWEMGYFQAAVINYKDLRRGEKWLSTWEELCIS